MHLQHIIKGSNISFMANNTNRPNNMAAKVFTIANNKNANKS